MLLTAGDSTKPTSRGQGTPSFVLALGLTASLAVNASATSDYFPKFGTPIVIGDRIIFAGPGWESQRVICITAEKGDKLWQISDPHQKLHPACAVDGRLLMTVEGNIESVNPTNGERALLVGTGLTRCFVI